MADKQCGKGVKTDVMEPEGEASEGTEESSRSGEEEKSKA